MTQRSGGSSSSSSGGDTARAQAHSELFDYLKIAEQSLRQMNGADGSNNSGADAAQVAAFLDTVIQEVCRHDLSATTANQRCSKSVEGLLKRGRVSRAGAARLLHKFVGASSSGSDEDDSDDADARAFVALLKNQYASHVLQTLLTALSANRLLCDSDSAGE